MKKENWFQLKNNYYLLQEVISNIKKIKDKL